MGRRKKEDSFESIFGAFNPQIENGPMAKIVELDYDVAKPCKECGRKARLHEVNFKDRQKHPARFYIDCGCGECDGKWYMTADEAITAWNEINQEGVPRPSNAKEDMTDFCNEFMRNFKIPD